MPIRMAVIGVMAAAALAAPARAEVERDARLAAAEEFVRTSDRYLHQEQLARGMKGYGLTVVAGTEIQRFDVEIVSVMRRWGLHQDVILARLSGLDLETAGVVAGMSGSPVYIHHEGKDKLIGAVAYGFFAQKTPICGIQPISQMLAVSDMVPRAAGEKESASSAPRGTARPRLSTSSFRRLFEPDRKAVREVLASPAQRPARASGAGLVPLTTPLMVSRARPELLERMRRELAPMGLSPVAAGQVGGLDAQAVGAVRLEPGSGITIPVVTGDADWYALGTVTDVVGDRLLAFGHSFLAQGDVDMPAATAYVHTVIPGVLDSFKLGSTLEVVGSLTRDEYVGVVGQIGRKVSMIPMEVRVHWADDRKQERYRFQICRHPWLTPMMVDYLIAEATWAWRELPEFHTVRHAVEIDFGELGRYTVRNVTSGEGIWAVGADAVLPLVAMLFNPFDEPPAIRSVSVELEISEGDTAAEILTLRLDSDVYRPGETVTGSVGVRAFRKPRFEMPVRFELPADLPEGAYSLTACDNVAATWDLQSEMPHLFEPRSVPALLEALQRVVELRGDRLYLRLPLRRGGLAVRQRELPDLPESKAGVLLQAEPIDTFPYTQSLVRGVDTPYVLAGSASAEFTVQRRPDQLRMRKPE